jgi:hypothetical protein
MKKKPLLPDITGAEKDDNIPEMTKSMVKRVKSLEKLI